MGRETGLKAFLALVWMVCLYRAITQSIVHDEALTYGFYIGAPWSQIFQFYDANHHFLNTLLMKLSVSLFGVSECSMRLPALGGAALYLAAVYRICEREIGPDAAAFLAAALLALNPMILDFMVAARGYGMALGFLMWALAILVAYVRRPEGVASRELLRAGAALSLSIMANLVFAVPAMVLTAAAWAMLKTSAGAAAGFEKAAEKKEAAGAFGPAARPPDIPALGGDSGGGRLRRVCSALAPGASDPR